LANNERSAIGKLTTFVHLVKTQTRQCFTKGPSGGAILPTFILQALQRQIPGEWMPAFADITTYSSTQTV